MLFENGLKLLKTLTCLLVGLMSSLGTISMRKSNWSNFVMAMAMSFLCSKGDNSY